MENYFWDIFLWISLFFTIGIINLPFNRLILPGLPDTGWIFSKISGLLIAAYLSWLLGMLKIFPFSNSLILLTIILLLTVNIFINRFTKTSWFGGVSLKIVLAEEMLFVAGFILWAFVRSHNPDIHDLEKYMDFGFINSILRSGYFPPKDMWLAGGNINYYYFGHLTAALVIKLLGTRPEVGYNLALALIFALTLTGSFSIGLNIYSDKIKRITLISVLSGILTAGLLVFSGNMQVIYALVEGFENYWYPQATRFIPNTIHEFPLYSFIVADLHGHLLDVPFVLLTVVFFYSNFFAGPYNKIFHFWGGKEKDGNDNGQEPHGRKNLVKYILTGFLLSALYMTNAADSVIYFGFFGLIILLKIFPSMKKNLLSIRTLWEFVKPLILTGVSYLIFSLPFQLTFKPFAKGINLVNQRSPIDMFLIVWSFSLFFVLSFIVFQLKKSSEQRKSDLFIPLLAIFSCILILVPEIIYFSDIYTEQPRTNTMFKFTYQAFILFSIISAYAIISISQKIIQKANVVGILWLLVSLNLLEIMSLYPYLAISSNYGNISTGKGRSLDGIKYLSVIRPGDYETIKWINENIKGQPVILEAVGESYTDYARISANTGLPTVLGWPVHEWLWRDDVKVTEVRAANVETVYNYFDLETAKRLLADYKVEYVYVGDLERERYPNLNEISLGSLGNLVYHNDSSKLIKVNQSE